MSFHRPTLSGKDPVVPSFASVFSWAGGVFAGCRVDVSRGFIDARLAVMFVANAMTVGGSEPDLYPLVLDGRLELRDAAVEGFFLCGSDGVEAGAGASTATAVVPSSN